MAITYYTNGMAQCDAETMRRMELACNQQRPQAAEIAVKVGKRLQLSDELVVSNINGLYTTIQYEAEVDNSDPTNIVYTLRAGNRLGMSYGIGQPASSAGFAAGRLGDYCLTNLNKGNATNDGENYLITHLEGFWLPNSEPTLIAEIIKNTAVFMSLKGNADSIPIGRLEQMAPPFGTWPSGLRQPPLDANNTDYPFPSHGRPEMESVLPVGGADGVLWRGAANVDSFFGLRFELCQDVVVTAQPRTAALPDVEGFSPPEQAGEFGTTATLVVYARGYGFSTSSANQRAGT